MRQVIEYLTSFLKRMYKMLALKKKTHKLLLYRKYILNDIF